MMSQRKIPRLLVPFGLGSLLVGGLVLLSRCFSPTLPACSYICNSTEPRCPDEYECRSDSYCHLRGSTESCPYSMDLGPAAPRPDMAATVDMAAAPPDQDAPDL